MIHEFKSDFITHVYTTEYFLFSLFYMYLFCHHCMCIVGSELKSILIPIDSADTTPLGGVECSEWMMKRSVAMMSVYGHTVIITKNYTLSDLAHTFWRLRFSKLVTAF